ncbi:MAG TPA: hypothetical protein VJ805_03010 [Nitrospiraceae bacterium]|nr:hypothetical protein [Nitrospiraceae bacterium]
MLHRLSLRVLPSLTLAVTEDAVRKQKRLVMFVPGLAAFVLYRAAKYVMSVGDPITLLALSGLVSAITAVCAYQVGRRLSLRKMATVDGTFRLFWIVGWVGFVYGVQLSLLVLALLWLVGYDYGLHPDGPAMMAIIISCTAVARDAFEIGHVRFLQAAGRPFVTFPDGVALRRLVSESGWPLARWVLAGLVACGFFATVMASIAPEPVSLMAQVAVVTMVAGAVTVFAYFDGRERNGGWMQVMTAAGWGELLKFWWWPGLAFAATYYLVLIGALLFPLRQTNPSVNVLIASAGVIGAVMGLYGYYLGHRRDAEDRIRQEVPASLLRCPFVMGILGRSGIGTRPAETAVRATLENSRQEV